MVLYKRKPVVYIRLPPLPNDLSTEVFFIPQSKEWFFTYEQYLARLDFYNSRNFVCEITGISNLTFFEALTSEEREVKEFEKNFPETLWDHLLRYLQFNRISRLGLLVDKVHQVFKNDFFPGETIFIKGNFDEPLEKSTHKFKGVIREKVEYGSDDQVKTKYLVIRQDNGLQAIVEGEHISRDRNLFTKWLVKTFIKLTLTRSHKIGAPWVVKEKYAKKYRIPQEFPLDLKQFESTTPTGLTFYVDSEGTSSSKPYHEAYKKNFQVGKFFRKVNGNSPSITDVEINLKSEPQEFSESERATPAAFANNTNLASQQPVKKNLIDDLNIPLDQEKIFAKPVPKPLELTSNAKEMNENIIKIYKEEFGEINETEDSSARKFFLEELARLQYSSPPHAQEALQSWMFLNVYQKPLNLSPVNFDDFMVSMSWNLSQLESMGPCKLLDEIWCSVLSATISNEPVHDVNEDEIQGSLVNFPEIPEDLEEDDEGDAEKEHDEGMVEGQEKMGNENGNEAGGMQHENGNEEDEEDVLDHKVYQVMNYRNISWHERIRRRNFEDGYWQCSLLGLISLYENLSVHGELVQKVYKILAPSDLPATPASVYSQFYEFLDVDLRIELLHIVTELLSLGQIVRKYLEECLEKSAALRRQRLDKIRDFRAAVVELQKINQLIQEAIAQGPEDVLSGLDESEQEMKMAELDPKFKKLLASREKFEEEMELQLRGKRALERELVVLDSQRVRPLGKDKFFNRYWWFESNGVDVNLKSDEHLHDEHGDDNDNDDDDDNHDDSKEKKDGSYLIGRLWVQGTSNSDMYYNLGYSKDDVEDFKAKAKFLSSEESSVDLFGLKKGVNGIFDENGSVLRDREGKFPNLQAIASLNSVKRRIVEEYPDPLLDGTFCRFYDTTEEIEGLVKYLNPWGKRESHLLKEILLVKEEIQGSIRARKVSLENQSGEAREKELARLLKSVNDELTNLENGSSKVKRTERIPSKRKLRGNAPPRKKPRLTDAKQILQSGDVQTLDDLKSALEEEIAKDDLTKKYAKLVEYENIEALDKFGKSLYDGGGKSKAKSKLPKKNGN